MEVMEDKALAHASKYQKAVYMSFDIIRMLWCGNSPDLNMIEPCWIWMKRHTTRNGALTELERRLRSGGSSAGSMNSRKREFRNG